MWEKKGQATLYIVRVCRNVMGKTKAHLIKSGKGSQEQ